MTEHIALCGAIRADQGEAVDCLLETAAARLKQQGVRVAGVLQRRAAHGDTCCADMGLELISTGETIEISQPLGSGSQGCRLDPRGLAEITACLLSELEDGPDLLFLNRFGKGEQEGEGFRQLIGRAVELSIPVLTAVRPPYLDAWRLFTGDLSEELPPMLDPVLDWCLKVTSPAQRIAANA
ncbi:DUF2478 domain-containing protein [Roseibium aggregatum]|uniref:DUF2478 domain-containing protein n=1 Tax=Roseibium aggregatum TaxID=187304 RepID=A0A939EI69_9HYPH|nr:DUF2478 domain-containing protein [Roseibium aggregatum]MBN9672728.1 DUF2478 domain-containing protein [Roseibium aggregatum]